jgi:hypothetical protein
VIAAPRQHLSDKEKALIKEGKAADEIWPGLSLISCVGGHNG